MKKSILAIIGGMIVIVLCLFLFHRHISDRTPIVVSFARYETDTNGVSRAWFAVTNPADSFVVCKAQAEPGISTPDWSAAVISIPAHGTATFGLPVRQTGATWQLTLGYWRVTAQPHSIGAGQFSGSPDFTAEVTVK
ncbi:MAG: hypothetical protein ACREFE_20185 [Limisphaerales bacterium]